MPPLSLFTFAYLPLLLRHAFLMPPLRFLSPLLMLYADDIFPICRHRLLPRHFASPRTLHSYFHCFSLMFRHLRRHAMLPAILPMLYFHYASSFYADYFHYAAAALLRARFY